MTSSAIVSFVILLFAASLLVISQNRNRLDEQTKILDELLYGADDRFLDVKCGKQGIFWSVDSNGVRHQSYSDLLSHGVEYPSGRMVNGQKVVKIEVRCLYEEDHP